MPTTSEFEFALEDRAKVEVGSSLTHPLGKSLFLICHPHLCGRRPKTPTAASLRADTSLSRMINEGLREAIGQYPLKLKKCNFKYYTLLIQ